LLDHKSKNNIIKKLNPDLHFKSNFSVVKNLSNGVQLGSMKEGKSNKFASFLVDEPDDLMELEPDLIPSTRKLGVHNSIKNKTKNKLNISDFNSKTSAGSVEYYQLEDPSVIGRAREILRVSNINDPVKMFKNGKPLKIKN